MSVLPNIHVPEISAEGKSKFSEQKPFYSVV